VTGNVEVRMIEQVEEISPELQAMIFGAKRHTL
jgi:hypothetical protein